MNKFLSKDYYIICHVDESEDISRLVFSLEKVGRNDKILTLPSDYKFDVIMPTNVNEYPDPEEFVKINNDPNNKTFVNQYRKFLEKENSGNINVPLEKIVESCDKLIDKKNEKTIKEMEKFKKVVEKEENVIKDVTKISGETEDRFRTRWFKSFN